LEYEEGLILSLAIISSENHAKYFIENNGLEIVL